MSDEKIKELFAKNLKKYLEANGKQPVDLVNDLNIPFSTVSNWINGIKMPRMGKVELLAQYFDIQKSDLLEEKKADPPNQEELLLLTLFRKLNRAGKTEALNRITEMTELSRFTKDTKLLNA